MACGVENSRKGIDRANGLAMGKRPSMEMEYTDKEPRWPTTVFLYVATSYSIPTAAKYLMKP